MKYIKFYAVFLLLAFIFIEPSDLEAAEVYNLDAISQDMVLQSSTDQAFETHICYIVKKEMSPSWPIEALKAQAVLARTFETKAGRKNGNFQTDTSAIFPKSITDAVFSTAGMILMWNGQPASVFYHADSGGNIASAADVWGGKIPYLMAKTEPFKPSGPTSQWQNTFSFDDIAARVAKYNINVGPIVAINILAKDSSGRVLQLEICGINGTQRLSGGKLRSALGLKSTLFDISQPLAMPQYQANKTANIPALQQRKSKIKKNIDRSTMPNDPEEKLIWLTKHKIFSTQELMEMLSKPEKYDAYIARGIARMSGKEPMPQIINTKPNITSNYPANYAGQNQSSGPSITFTGRGWGHGVGMSQWGAKTMAEHGWDFKQILSFYFPGTTLGYQE